MAKLITHYGEYAATAWLTFLSGTKYKEKTMGWEILVKASIISKCSLNEMFPHSSSVATRGRSLSKYPEFRR
jgi:hypothetical protein